jgi:hypothetical protein
MGFYAEPWLKEARDRIKSMSARPGGADSASADFNTVAEVVEKAIKAALIETSGTIPQGLENQNLVSICQSTGMWDVLPPALRGLVEEVESLRANSDGVPQSLKSESTTSQLQRYFQVTRGLIDYMEFHVIGNDSVLKRLKVA